MSWDGSWVKGKRSGISSLVPHCGVPAATASPEIPAFHADPYPAVNKLPW